MSSADNSPQSPDPSECELIVREIQTRFIFPFLFHRDSVSTAVQVLENAKIVHRDNVWRNSDAPPLYRDELTRHIDEFLFPKSSPSRTSAAYLRVNGERLQQLLPKGFLVVLEDSEKWAKSSAAKGSDNRTAKMIPASALQGEGIELFLSDQGIGVLSITLAARDLTLDQSIEFNYRLALVRRNAALFYIPHPHDDQEKWSKIPDQQRALIPAPPAFDASPDSRLGAAGGAFSMNELRHFLLISLQEVGLDNNRDGLFQPQLSLYSVVRFDSSVDLADRPTKRRIGRFLGTLAQVEEPSHAGAEVGKLPIPNRMLNRNHWAASGFYAAAHVLVDQKPPRPEFTDHPFNSARVIRVRDKYFTSYLIAEMQRLVLHQALSDAGRIMAVSEKDSAAQLADLRRRLLKFALRGQFDQVSHRYAVHRFYLLVRRGLSLDDAWGQLRQIVAELDSLNVSDRQERMQHAAHFIEMFVASVYFAHLTEMILHAGEMLHENPSARVGLIVGAALAGLGFAFLVTRRMDHHDSERHSQVSENKFH